MLQKFKGEFEELYKKKVGKFEDVIEEKLKNKFASLNKNSYKTEHIDLNFLASINFCMFAIHSYTKCSCSDLVPIKELSKVVTTKTLNILTKTVVILTVIRIIVFCIIFYFVSFFNSSVFSHFLLLTFF